jgi:hypothetical protein
MAGYQQTGIVLNFGIPTTDHDPVHGQGRTLTHAVSVEDGIIDLMYIMWSPGESFMLI